MALTDDELDAVSELLHAGIETSGQLRPTLTALAEKMRGDLSDVSERELEFLEMLAELRHRILTGRQRAAFGRIRGKVMSAKVDQMKKAASGPPQPERTTSPPTFEARLRELDLDLARAVELATLRRAKKDPAGS